MVSASGLLLPSSVRDFASCVSDGAVRVACTTPSSTHTASTTTSSSPSTLSVAVSYLATPPSSPPLLLRLTWSHTPLGPPTLSFAGPAASSPVVLLRRRKGTRREQEAERRAVGQRRRRARRLRWNFRGNQTVFVDGEPVDVLWDLHDWWFRDPPGCAVVMLRARGALESRLWRPEEARAPAFALLVQAFKTPP